jgi:enoyl-CoA hydratase/carnithine racemase
MAERAGVGNAMLHLLTGDEFDSAEALRCNFVQKVVPAGQELAEALRIAERIAQQAPQAVVATRQNVLKAIELGQAAAVADFIPVQQRLANSEDAAEGVRSFIEKRRHGSPEPAAAMPAAACVAGIPPCWQHGHCN